MNQYGAIGKSKRRILRLGGVFILKKTHWSTQQKRLELIGKSIHERLYAKANLGRRKAMVSGAKRHNKVDNVL